MFHTICHTINKLHCKIYKINKIEPILSDEIFCINMNLMKFWPPRWPLYAFLLKMSNSTCSPIILEQNALDWHFKIWPSCVVLNSIKLQLEKPY